MMAPFFWIGCSMGGLCLSSFLSLVLSGFFSPSLSPFSLLSSFPPFLPVGICFFFGL